MIRACIPRCSIAVILLQYSTVRVFSYTAKIKGLLGRALLALALAKYYIPFDGQCPRLALYFCKKKKKKKKKNRGTDIRQFYIRAIKIKLL